MRGERGRRFSKEGSSQHGSRDFQEVHEVALGPLTMFVVSDRPCSIGTRQNRLFSSPLIQKRIEVGRTLDPSARSCRCGSRKADSRMYGPPLGFAAGTFGANRRPTDKEHCLD